jgi:mRNA interferase MazF
LSRSESGLPQASVVNVSQVLTIDRALLNRRVKLLSATTIHSLDQGLRLVLGI